MRALAALLLALLGAMPARAAGWAGTYTYEGMAGYDGGGTAATGNAIVLDLTLNLAAKTCTLSAEGFQTDETLNCTTAPLPEGIEILFAGIPAGDPAQNGFFSAPDRLGALLFSLRRTGGKLITRWGAIKPSFVNTDSGAFFTPGG